jgi:hypothetical protein
LKFISPVDVSDPNLRSDIESFWEEVRALVQQGKISSYSSKGTFSRFVQLRTKGSGLTQSVCPVTGEKFNSRAFYATKRFINSVRGNLC